MNSESKKGRDKVAEQIASIADRQHSTADDVDMLADIQDGISKLLAANGGNEQEVRRVLKERFDAGAMRRETFQLVKSMLDGFASEIASPSARDSAPILPDPPFQFGEIPVEPTWKPATEAPSSGVSYAPSDRDTLQTTSVVPDSTKSGGRSKDRAQIGSLLRDRFLLHKEISGGSMGVVYKAMDRRLAEAGSDSHWVAIKVLSPKLAENSEALRALQQEAVKGRFLIHPNIVRTIDLDRDDDLYFIVMEWMEGRTLAAILDSDERSTIDYATSFKIVRQIGAALEYAHQRGIVHADIKPGNIMILPNGDAKLFDFGVARAQHNPSAVGFDPGVLGAITPAYSSMQVLTGDEPVASDDVFSLACLLYRLIAGNRVYGARNAAEASLEGLEAQRLEGVSNSQWRAIKKALSYSRVTRYASIGEFLAALEVKDFDARGDDDDVSFSVAADQRFMDEPESNAGKWVVATLLILGAAGFGAYQYGYLDPILAELSVSEDPVATTIPEEPIETIEDEVIIESADAIAEPVAENEDGAQETQEDGLAEDSPVDLQSGNERSSNAVGPASSLVDFSSLPAPDLVIPLAANGAPAETISATVREDGSPLILDFERKGDLTNVLSVRLEEVGFSGNRSPWASGQYALSDSGIVRFPVGQNRGRLTLTMASDGRREADQISTLRIRDLDFANSERAVLQVSLEDDDRRAFAAQLPADTVAFAASQVRVRESDPAVQIDIVRFNPNDNALRVRYSISDISATDGDDYFAPGSTTISFGPQQRSARILVPLVQDQIVEGDETFVVELVAEDELIIEDDLAAGDEPATSDTNQRVLVVIRDDESQNL